MELPVEGAGSADEKEGGGKKKHAKGAQENHEVSGKVAREYYLNEWRVCEYVTPKGRHYFEYHHPDGKQKFFSKRQAEFAGFTEA